MYYTGTDGKPYPAEKNIRSIEGSRIVTWQRNIVDCNILEIEAGTNGFQGGDSGHGSRTYIRIKDLASTDIRCAVKNDPVFGADHAEEIEIVLGGDAELETFKEALRWMLSILEVQSEGQ